MNFGLDRHSYSEKRGFSLVEVVFAIGVVSFCMLTLSALIPVGLNANRLSREQITALNLCRDIESDMKATPITSSLSLLYQIPIPSAGTTTFTLYDCNATPGSSANTSNPIPSFTTTATPTSQYRFTITLVAPAANSPNDPAMAYIVVTWPASATTTPVGKVSLDVAINRVGS